VTRWDELAIKAKELSDRDIQARVRSLATDERFVALVALIERDVDQFGAAACSQVLAPTHGKLAHAAGSAHAMRVFRGQLAACIAVPLRSRKQEGPPED